MLKKWACATTALIHGSCERSTTISFRQSTKVTKRSTSSTPKWHADVGHVLRLKKSASTPPVWYRSNNGYLLIESSICPTILGLEMGIRDKAIIKAILRAILHGPRNYSLLQRLWALFAIFHIPLQRFEHDQFRRLREVWKIDEGEYWQSFEARNNDREKRLISLSELGYSGSVGC